MSDGARAEDSTLALQKATQAVEQRRFVLEVQAGADCGLKLTLDAADPGQAPRVLCGTSPICELRLTDRTISRRHLALELDGLSLRVTDLDSTNGTIVNGVSIGEAFLAGGESIQLGDTTLFVSAADARVSEPQPAANFGRFLGQSEAIARLVPFFERWANSPLPLLIEGETGTGKELLAEALHEASPRAGGPFVVFDCAAVSPQVAELALFGREAAAPDAPSEAGVFEQAQGGTLLFDEIAEFAPTLQAKLLRVFERGQFLPLGSARPKRIDARCVFATRRDLDKEVQAGRFREDLFFRIAVARLELPPLRRRSGDIPLLARHFWQTGGGEPRALDSAYITTLEAYAWPGNVRELKNAVARKLTVGDLGPHSTNLDVTGSFAAGPAQARSQPMASDWLDSILAQGLPLPAARKQVLDTFLRRYVARVLSEHGGNVSHAAAASGLARRYFQLIKARQR